MNRIIIKKIDIGSLEKLKSSLKGLGFVNIEISGDWMMWSLRYNDFIVTSWINKDEECTVQMEMINCE